MPYIKPKLEPTTTTYNPNQIKTSNTSNQSPLQTEGSQVTERNKHEDKNSGSLSSPTPSGKGVNETGVIIEKYMIEIKRYPDGKVYTNMFSIGVQRQVNKALQKPAKKVTQLNLKEKEIEELE